MKTRTSILAFHGIHPHGDLKTQVPAALLLVLCGTLAHAGTFTWNNTTGDWNVPANWGGTAPTGTNATDVLVFGGSVGTVAGSAPNYTATNNIATVPFRFNRLTLETTDAGASGLDNFIKGSALQLTGTAPQILENGTGFTVDAPIDLAANTEFGGTSTGTVTLNHSISGTSDIVKNGPGTFRFGTPFVSPATGPSANTWFGRLTINAGTFRFNNNAQAAPTALRSNPVTMSAGATLLFASKVTDPESSARMGTLSGTGGLVQARGQLNASSQDSLDIGIYAFTDGDYAGTLSNTRIGTQSAGHQTGVITVRGTSVQTLSGTLDIEKDVAVGGGATLRFAGTASLGTQASGAIVLNGGSFILDNSITNHSNRLRDGTTGSTGLDVIGGGLFSLVGNALGATETVARLQLGSATKARSGALNVSVTHNGGSSAPTALTFQSYARDQTQNPCVTVNFSARNAAGTPLTLGLSGNNPRIVFGGAFTPPLFNGLLGNSISGDATTVGWATVNGNSFATHGANGISAVTLDATPGAGSGGNTAANIQLTASFAPTTSFAVNTIKLTPTAAGQSLSLPASGDLRTAAILLAGATDFSITSAGAGIGNAGTTGPRYFHVQQAVLNVGASLATSTSSPVVKAGDGTLVLTNSANIGVTVPVYLNAGSFRATPGSSLPAGELRFRGGVLEITGGGTFSRTVGYGQGNLTWSGIDALGAGISEERGSGGFAAIGADVTVDLNTAGATTFVWEDPGFLDSGFALVFGSANANARVTFNDNINLTQTAPLTTPPALNYNAREIRVVDNPSSANDYAVISGVISGSPQNDLLKTGGGLLELTAANTLQGNVLLAAGTLKLTGSLSSSVLTDVQNGATLTGTGTAKLILLENGGHIAPGNGGIGTLNASGLTWRAGGVANFDLGSANSADRIALGSGAFTKGSTNGTFAFDFGGTGTPGQTYTLATFGSTTFTAADFTATNLASGVTGTFQLTGGTLTFSVPLPPLEAWRQLYFGSGATNSGSAANTADPDGDGRSNFQEYAFGGNPTVKDSSYPVSAITSGPVVQWSYVRRSDDPALVYSHQSTENLTTWLAATPVSTTSQPYVGATGYSTITVQFNRPIPAPAKWFLRAKVE